MSLEVKRAVKNGIKKLLASRGYVLMRTDAQQVLGTMESALAGIARRQHSFNTVVDVGASDGSWTRLLLPHFPACQYLLIEAQAVHEESLERFAREQRNVQFALAAAADRVGEINFDGSDPFGGRASVTPFATHNLTVPVTTIDHEVGARGLRGPYLLKLDTHGFEVPILGGGERTLADTEVLVIECYNFRIAPECLLFNEMCDYLKRFGLRCIDLVDAFHRPYDGSFWQADLVFVKETRPEFDRLSWK